MTSFDLKSLASAIILPGALVAAVPHAAAQSAPNVGDFCTSDRNGLNNAGSYGTQPRSCAAVTTTGVRGTGIAQIGNGRDSGSVAVGGGSAVTGWSKEGYANSATANSENGGTGSASSDLTTGQLKAAASNTQSQSFILTRMGDEVTINNSSGSAQEILLGYMFDGSFAGAGGDGSNSGYVALSLFSNSIFTPSGNGGAYLQTNFAADGTYQQTQNSAASDFIFSSFGTPGSGTFSGSALVKLLVPTGESKLLFGFALYTQCRVANSICDFGNTSSLNFAGLPNGVSFTSGSGVFLSGLGAGAVPEPATWAMMICGFGLIGGAMRRRQQLAVRFARA